jgi:hypothetical protein
MKVLTYVAAAVLALVVACGWGSAAPKAEATSCEMSCLVLDAYDGLPVEGARVLVYWQTPSERLLRAEVHRRRRLRDVRGVQGLEPHLGRLRRLGLLPVARVRLPLEERRTAF